MNASKRKKLSSKEIAEYLILNPDFFKENPEVLSSIEIVHESGAAVSLIQKQVELLRSNYNATTDELMKLLGIAKTNENIFSLTKKLIIELVDASNTNELVNILENSFESDFGAKTSRLLFFTDSPKNLPKDRIRSPSEAKKKLETLLKPDEIYCGEIDKDLANFIFNKKSKINEIALVPLNCNSVKGLIALGSDEPGKYNKNKDTLFLDFIAEVVSKLVDNHNT